MTNKSIEDLIERSYKLYNKKGWSLHWADRLAYFTLEASEFIEATRGKGGDPVDEAGDVLITFLTLITHDGVTLEEAVKAAHKKIDSLMG